VDKSTNHLDVNNKSGNSTQTSDNNKFSKSTSFTTESHGLQAMPDASPRSSRELYRKKHQGLENVVSTMCNKSSKGPSEGRHDGNLNRPTEDRDDINQDKKAKQNNQNVFQSSPSTLVLSPQNIINGEPSSPFKKPSPIKANKKRKIK